VLGIDCAAQGHFAVGFLFQFFQVGHFAG
jgi:hypothetical protein